MINDNIILYCTYYLLTTLGTVSSKNCFVHTTDSVQLVHGRYARISAALVAHGLFFIEYLCRSGKWKIQAVCFDGLLAVVRAHKSYPNRTRRGFCARNAFSGGFSVPCRTHLATTMPSDTSTLDCIFSTSLIFLDLTQEYN